MTSGICKSFQRHPLQQFWLIEIRLDLLLNLLDSPVLFEPYDKVAKVLFVFRRQIGRYDAA